MRCRPDRFYAGDDPDRERLELAMETVRREPTEIRDITALAAAVGIGTSKLYGLTLHHLHVTPGELLHRLRLDAALRRAAPPVGGGLG